jgi:hypothetical protein
LYKNNATFVASASVGTRVVPEEVAVWGGWPGPGLPAAWMVRRRAAAGVSANREAGEIRSISSWVLFISIVRPI